MAASLPVDGESTLALAIGGSIDRTLAGRLRAFGEYEYLDLDGDAVERAHRVHAGLRRRLVETMWSYRTIAFAIEAEIGGGVMLADHEVTGAFAEPHAFVGARAVLGLLWDRAAWKRQLIEYEIVLRGLASRDGPGVLVGLGITWGR